MLNKRRFFLSKLERFNKSFLKSWELVVSSHARDRGKRHRFHKLSNNIGFHGPRLGAYLVTRFLKLCRPTWELNRHYTRQFHQQIFKNFSLYTECEHSLSFLTFSLEDRKARIPSRYYFHDDKVIISKFVI